MVHLDTYTKKQIVKFFLIAFEGFMQDYDLNVLQLYGDRISKLPVLIGIKKIFHYNCNAVFTIKKAIYYQNMECDH